MIRPLAYLPRLAAIALWLAAVPDPARAGLIYDVSAAGSSDFVPFEDDGTPNRPQGDRIGNEITFAGTDRYVTSAEVVLSRIGPVEIDNYTIDLYRPDGTVDPNSGLRRPGTLIGSFTTSASNAFIPGTGAFVVDWSFVPTLVPDTVIAVVSSTYSTTTPGQLMGPFAAVMPPLTGSALNTTWYGDGSPSGWTADPNWAINDGGVTNYLDMRFTAQATAAPEPGSLLLVGTGVLGLAMARSLRGRKVRAGAPRPPGTPDRPAGRSWGGADPAGLGARNSGRGDHTEALTPRFS